MSIRYADRVKETSTTTGTGTYDLAGAVTGFQGFVAGIGDDNQCFYVAEDGTNWEVGRGTVTDAVTDTLSRDEILASSNAGSAVNWAAGTRNIFVTFPARDIARNVGNRYSLEDATDYVDAGMGHEFLDGTLGGYTAVNISSGTVDFLTGDAALANSIYDLTTRLGSCLVQLKDSVTAGLRIDQLPADGESIIAKLGMPSTNSVTNNLCHIGIVVNDNDTDPDLGNYVRIYMDGSDSDKVVVFNGSAASLNTPKPQYGDTFYCRLSRDGSNLYFSFSVNGKTWVTSDAFSVSTYDNFWIYFGRFASSADDVTPIYELEWIRHVASIALDPW